MATELLPASGRPGTVVLVDDEPEEYGAFKYIVKPFEPDELRGAVERARKLYRLARMKREALKLLGANAVSADRAGLEASFDARCVRCGSRSSPSCVLRTGAYSATKRCCAARSRR